MHLIDQQLDLMIRGRFDEAWKLAQDMYANDPENIRSNFNRGWFLINQGNLQEGFQCLESGRFLKVYGAGLLNTSKPIWDQSDLKDKTVIINMEGGYGDQIIYARFATEVSKRGGKCYLCCEPIMHSMFSRIGGVEKCITWSDVKYTYHDFWIPAFSCSWLFGHTFDTLPNKPYLAPKLDSLELWSQMIPTDKKFKVGIRWSGNPKFEHQQFRIFPSELLINLYKDNSHIQFYSLQRDNDLRELPDDIVDLQHLLISWEDTMACIANLDLVITSCTSVAHLSAAMGKPTWVVVPILPYHCWAYGGDHSPWYTNDTKVFRQTKFGEWEDTFEKVGKELKEVFPKF